VPSAYRETLGADKNIDIKMPSIKATLYRSKGIYTKQGFKRRYAK
jgi:hypothetical protein